MSDPQDPAVRDNVWTLEVTRPDGTVESRKIAMPVTPDEPFNSDGFWKAVILGPEGALRCVPLLAVVAEVVEAPPHLFVWVNDTAVECETVPGFICALGTDQDEAAVLRHTRDSFPAKIAAWAAAFDRARRRLG
jgi:hypothetical protein